MTRIQVRTAGLRKLLTVEKVEGRPDQWKAYMHGFLPEEFTAESIGIAVVNAIEKAMQFSRDPSIIRKARGSRKAIEGPPAQVNSPGETPGSPQAKGSEAKGQVKKTAA